MTPLRPDARGVTVPMNYVLLIGIVAVLSVVLLAGTAGFVTDQREGAARAGLEVVGNRVATDLSTADRLARTIPTGGDVTLTTDLPETVAGTPYQVTFVETSADGSSRTYDIVLATADPGVTVTVPVRTTRALSATAFDGGRLVVSSDGGSLEVRDA